MVLWYIQHAVWIFALVIRKENIIAFALAITFYSFIAQAGDDGTYYPSLDNDF